jgi:hypothetical protein
MPKIDGTSELVNALRSQLVARSETLRTDSARSKLTDAATRNGSAAISVDELRKRLGRSIRALDLSIAANRRQARLMFIESVIAWDFGDNLLNDPQFSLFVRDVEASMCSDPTVGTALDLVLSQLLLDK